MKQTKFRDLDGWLKAAVIMAYAVGSLYIFSILYGVVSVLNSI